MKALTKGTKVKLRHRIWKGVPGFLLRTGTASVPKGTIGLVTGRKKWEGSNLYTINFGSYGTWGARRSDITPILIST